MDLEEYFPFWTSLSDGQKKALARSAARKRYRKGETVHGGGLDCIGLLIVERGQLRVFSLSEEGREITLYRLLERDICLFSASCILRGLQFDMEVEAASDTDLIHIPADIFRSLMRESAAAANFTNELMADRFSSVMWLLDQVLYKRMDARLSAFLLEERALIGGDALSLTHEAVARHLGTAREVVTRMLKYLQAEGAVSLSRGGITILDTNILKGLAAGSIR